MTGNHIGTVADNRRVRAHNPLGSRGYIGKKIEPLGNPTVLIFLMITVAFEAGVAFFADIYWTRENLGALFTVYFGVVAVVAGGFSHVQMARVTNNVDRLVEEKILPLYSFVEVFSRARKMISDADEEIHVASFVCRFGGLHTENDDVKKEYSIVARMEPPAFGVYEKAVEQFLEKLNSRAFELPRLRLIVSAEADLRDIVRRLKKENGYNSLNIDEIIKSEREARARLIETSKTGSGGVEIYEMPTMPQQVIIARLVRDNGFIYYATLVFLVGDDLVSRGEICGYYTESDTVADVYRSYLDNCVAPRT